MKTKPIILAAAERGVQATSRFAQKGSPRKTPAVVRARPLKRAEARDPVALQPHRSDSARTTARRSSTKAECREFGDKGNRHPLITELYRNAQAQLRKQKKSQKSVAAEAKTETDSQRLLHELQVHQVELEMQNAELQEGRNRMEVLLDKFTDLYDFSPVGYFTLAAAGTIRQVNLTGAHLVGVERSRLIGQRFRTLVPPAQRPAFDSFLKEVFEDQSSRSIDIGLVNQGQSLQVIRIRAQRSPTGQECRAVVVDITELNREMNKVRVSEIRYRRLFEAAHDGVLILDPGTRKITDANPFITTLLGYTHGQLVGKELFEIGLLKDEAASREMFEQLKWQHDVRYEDLPLESKGGRLQQVEVVANLYQENGHAVIQCNIRDITARKEAEDALRRNEALFAALVQQAPVGVMVMNDNFLLQQVNPVALRDFKKVHPLIGRDFFEIMRGYWPKQVADEITTRFRHTMKTGEPYQVPEFTQRRRDTGVLESYEWQTQRVTLPAGARGLVCFFNNITERKLVEETQRRLEVMAASNRKLQEEILRRRTVEVSLMKSEQHQRDLLAQSDRMQEQLRQLSRQILLAQEEERKRISRELHDVISQTLTGINIRLAALKVEAGRDPRHLDRDIGRTQRLVEKSVELVHEFARELRPTVLDDLGLIPALHSFVKLFSKRTHLHVHLTAFAGVEKLDINKRTMLYRVAQEALNNVSRHAQASRAEVSIEQLPTSIGMKIHDNGKSFNVDGILKAKGKKRLGLLGMRERVEMVGGTFGIESAPGKGTTVQVEIPFGKLPPPPEKIR